MSTGGRGRGYLGRHHIRDDLSRPGDSSPRTTDKTTNPGDLSRASGDKATHTGDKVSGDKVTQSGDKSSHTREKNSQSSSSTPRSEDRTPRGRDKTMRTVDKTGSDITHQSSKKVADSGERSTNSRDMSINTGDNSMRASDKSRRSVDLTTEETLETPIDVHCNSVGPKDANSRSAEEGRRPPGAREPLEETPRALAADDEQTLAELLRVEEQHRPIVAMLEQFAPGEDGIAFNRKLREFEATLTALCHDDAQLQQAFGSLRGAALGSAALARKLATVGASFTRQQRQNVLRMALLNVMQSTFAKLEVIQRASPQILTNAATLMGDYFMEARLGNGSKVQLLCSPLLQYLRSLLASGDRRAHRALATQLMQNGRELITTNAQELDELSISIRIRLLSAPPASIIWLLLSADLCINKFLPLPTSLQGFYASNLDLMQDAETVTSYSEVSYGSWKKPDKEEVDSEKADASHLNLSDDNSTRKLRPILGAGAALTRQNNSFSEPSAAQDSQDVWSKTGLAKRYDLNSWRQQENDDKDDIQEDLASHGSSELKFIPSQQFVPNESYRDFQREPSQSQGYVPAAYPPAQYSSKFSHNAATFTPGERYASQPPFPPHADGKFTTPPPFAPPAAPNEKFSNPPPFVPAQDRINPPSDGKFSTPPPFVPERGNAERISQFVAERVVNVERTVQNQFVPERVVNVERPAQSQFVPERVVSERPAQFAEKQNFPSSERPRRPPENWRKEMDEERGRQPARKTDWGRKEEPAENGEAESRVGYRDGSGDAKPFKRAGQRESRPRQGRKGEEEEKAPARRQEKRMDVPRSHKYWDHDDRLDKDYNS